MSVSVAIEPASAEALSQVVKDYDVRGLCPEQLDDDLARALGAAFAAHLGAQEIVVGRDMRATSQQLAASFAEGVTAVGCDVIDLGLASTDLVYFATGYLSAAGAMITASHNPAAYNGIKLCGASASPIGRQSGLGEIAVRAAAGFPSSSLAAEPGRVFERDLLEEFVSHVRSFIDVDALAPLRVVADTANAMGGYVLPPTVDGLGLEVSLLHAELDGSFPNHLADPLKPENLADLQAEVSAVGADVGLAFDGDADRVFLVDELSQPISGSLTTALVATGTLERNGAGPILHNLICSRAVPEAIAEAGGQPVRTRVGHSYIKAEMARTQAAFGGEHSGHYYFARNYNADSGLIAALIVLERISVSSQSLSELVAPFDRYVSSGELNFAVADPAERVEAVSDYFARRDPKLRQDRLDGLTVEASPWWFNLRPSNTEPLLRLNVEADSKSRLGEMVDEVTSLLG